MIHASKRKFGAATPLVNVGVTSLFAHPVEILHDCRPRGVSAGDDGADENDRDDQEVGAHNLTLPSNQVHFLYER